MKKKLVPIIASILAVVVLAAIGWFFMANRGMQSKEDDEFIPSAGKVDVSDLKEEKIKIYIQGRASRAMDDVLKAVNEKLRAEIKTELAFELVAESWENYFARIRQDIAAGYRCDAFFYTYNYPISLGELAKEGIAADITKDFPMYAPGYYQKFSGDELAAISTNGRLYAVPYRIPTAVRKCVMVRDDLMSKYNIPEIKNYDDYEVYLDTIKQKEPDMIPVDYWDTSIGLFSEVNGYVVLDYELGLVYKLNDPSMKLMAWDQTPEFKDAINRIKSWYDKGYFLQNVGIAQIDENIVTSGKWASLIGNWGDEYSYNSLLEGKGIKDYKYIAYTLHDGYSSRNSPLEASIVINKKSKNADRVLMFVDWLQSKQENYDLLMYGIKGKHYNDMGDFIVPTEEFSGAESFFQWGWKAPFRNIEYERVNYPGLKDSIVRYNKVLEEKTKFPPHIGITLDYSSVSDIVTLRRSGYYSVENKIYNGIFEPEDLDEYINEQQDGGVQNLISAIQKQLDDFRKAK